jgi:hypothetical protein
VDVSINVKNPILFVYRSTILLCAFLALCIILSLLFFIFTSQWTKRVLFFPEVSSKKFEAEVRYLPEANSNAGNIRILLEDLLLGPSNFGYSSVLPTKSSLHSVMFEDGVLYVGFSKSIYQLDNNLFGPREMLQAIANSLYFNFPWLKKIYFFIDGKALSDLPLLHRVDRKLDFAKMLVPLLSDLGATIQYLSTNPLSPVAAGRDDLFFFQNGAQWDESLLK